MNPEPIRRIQKIEEGEVLKLGPPMAGELILKVTPQPAGTGFAMAVQTLLPHSHLPLHRYLQHDVVLFIYKGQGRAVVDSRNVTVVPGTTLHIPKQVWYGLRNTGTGALQFLWTLVPNGAEQFFRELAMANAPMDMTALQTLALRHGMEVRSERDTGEATPTMHEGRRRRRHRGGKQAHRPAQAALPPAIQAPPIQPAATPEVPADRSQPAPIVASSTHASAGGRQAWRRRRGRSPASRSTTPVPPGPPQGPAPSRPTASPPRRESDRRHHGRTKEVYMGGRWVRVAGDGPVIAPGKS